VRGGQEILADGWQSEGSAYANHDNYIMERPKCNKKAPPVRAGLSLCAAFATGMRALGVVAETTSDRLAVAKLACSAWAGRPHAPGLRLTPPDSDHYSTDTCGVYRYKFLNCLGINTYASGNKKPRR
jgi:hypothetical protein